MLIRFFSRLCFTLFFVSRSIYVGVRVEFFSVSIWHLQVLKHAQLQKPNTSREKPILMRISPISRSNYCWRPCSKAHGCQGSGSTLGLSRKQLAHELREGSGALRDETHPVDTNFLQTETRERQMSIDVHPSLRRCLEKKSNSQDHRNEKTRSRRYEKL